MSVGTGVDKALRMLAGLPRVCIGNLKALPYTRKLKRRCRRGQHGGRKRGYGNKGQGQHNTLPPIGFEGGNTPFYLLIPTEPYYAGHHTRREYPPLSLMSLQRLVDLGRIDPTQPVDLTTLCNTKILNMKPLNKHYGINLIDEGADIFKACLHLEVQAASELAIAAIERMGGRITTRFYDLACVEAMIDPRKFFSKGLPIPRCKLPPQDAVGYYSDPLNRGYLADPDKVAEARVALAQKYGYKLPIADSNPLWNMAKDPRQIWFGLEPGWVINVTDRCILKPTDDKIKDYYKS